MTIWDRGTYETLKWEDYEVDVVLHGERVEGHFTFLRKGQDKNWIVRRRGAPQDPAWQPLPEQLTPMLASPSAPARRQHDEWAYEFKWDGVRALARVEGGRLQIFSRAGNEVTVDLPGARRAGRGARLAQAWLDGEIVALRRRQAELPRAAERMHVQPRRAGPEFGDSVPVTYLIFDVLHLDGRSCLDLPFAERRALLEKSDLNGRHWHVSPSFDGAARRWWRPAANKVWKA